MKKLVLFASFFVLIQLQLEAQDSVRLQTPNAARSRRDSIPAIDTAAKKGRSPQSKAALRSAIVPGLGQIYNKKYWKLPLVYAGIGIPAYTYFYNRTWFNKTRIAYRYVVDSTSVPKSNIDPRLQALVDRRDTRALTNYRDEFRRNMDYSILAFLILWGLNVMDAAVDAHLKGFDISEDLTLKFKPGFSEMGNTAGLSLVLQFGPTRSKPLSSR